MPDFSFENEMSGTVAGVDEVGRGPLAGPVLAAAVTIDQKKFPSSLIPLIDDSKKLSSKKREVLNDTLWNTRGISIGVGRAEVHEIDNCNILNATHLAMARAVDALPFQITLALVDGNRAPPLPCDVRTVVKGDSISVSIAAASIVAKVKRDRLMIRLAMEFPGYGWETNMGYGTEKHLAALEQLGPTVHHRRSFAPVKIALKSNAL